MFLGYQKNKIVYVADTKEKLENNFMIFDKVEETQDNYVINSKGEYTIDGVVAYTDAEIVATRANLYSSVSDPLFASYNQGGGSSLTDAINAKAQIQFDNKKSDQTNMTLADFEHKVRTEYDLAHKPDTKGTDLSFRYVENASGDDIIVNDEAITLARMNHVGNILLPKITKTQIVKIDNTSDDIITVTPFKGDFIDGQSSLLTVSAQQSIEIIADTSTATWDIYTYAIENETPVFKVSDLFGNEVETTELQVGMGMKVIKTPDNKAKVELDLASLGIDDEPPCYYASISANEKLTDNNGDIIHDGTIWYDDIIVSNKTNFFDIDRPNKAIGIQGADDNDPNVTGGEAYLLIYRDVLSGKAPEDGFIENAIRDRDTQEILPAANGLPLAVYETFSAKDNYRTIRIAAIIEAKNLVYYQHHLLDNFSTKGTISLQPYTRGNSCMCIQGLDANHKTGKALTKYELDTGERVLIDRVWDEDANKFIWILKGFETIEEKQMKFENDRAILYNPMPKGSKSYRFSLTNTYKKVPFGIVKSGDIPFDLAGWTKKEGTDYGNENDLIAVDDMDIEVLAQPNLHVTVKEPVYMCLTKKNGETYTPIQGTEVSYTPKADHEIAPIFPIMKAKVRNRDIIGVSMKSTSPNGAYIETDDPQYSLITFTINTKGAV